MQRQSPSTMAREVPPPRPATLRCLGSASVTVELAGDLPHAVVGLGKPLALLTYLALAPSRSASRERLTDLLWSDQDRPTARHSLRVALHYLRSRIGDWVLESDDRACTVSPNLAVDALSFSAAVDQGEFLRAFELYRGDFLSEFASPGCREFEQWAEVERAHLRSRAVRAGEAWCQRALDRGDSSEARHAAARIRDIDPQSELGWRLGIEVLVASGDRVGAAAEAVRFQAWLETEGREPEQASHNAIRAAQHVAGSDDSVNTTSRSLIAEFTGRERQFAGLLTAWKEATHGKTRVVVVSGGAGLGKSRLLEAVANRLKSLRRRVLAVRAYHGERSNPYSFAAALAYELGQLRGAAGMRGSLAPHLVALDSRLSEQFHVAPATTDGAAATQRATAIRELLSAVCDEAPLALLLDDAHWFDDASRQVVAGALARLSSASLLVVITTRSSDAGLGLDEAATRLPLAPLSQAEVEALIASLGVLPKNEPWAEFFVARVTASSRGVPLLVLNALEQLLGDGTLALRDGTWQARDRERVRERLRRIDALGARLRALSERHFSLLVACGICGVPLPCRIAEALAPSSSGDQAPAADELERLGYLRKTGDCVEVAHDAFAEAAVEIAGEATQNRVRMELGKRLVAESEEPWVERGIRLLLAAGDVERAHAALWELMRRNRRRLQRGPANEVARILGLPMTDARVRAAVRSLPLTMKVSARRPAIAAAVVLVIGFAATVAARRDITTPPDAVLEITVRQDRLHARSGLVAIRAQTWATTPLRSAWQRARIDTTRRPRVGSLVIPGKDEWANEWQAPDSGGIDVALFEPRGFVRRLTSARADEAPGSWSPDGKRLAIETSQFGVAGHRVIAELDLLTGAIRPLTSGSGFDGGARWSPDGTRIAFGRDPRDGSGALVCVIAVAGGAPSCARAPVALTSVLGWANADRVLLQVGIEGTLVDLDATTMLLRPRNIRLTNQTADLSPDGRWLAYYPRGTPTVSDIRVVSTSDLQSTKDVIAPSISGDVTVAWRGTAAIRDFLDTLRFDAAPDSLPADSPCRLKVAGISNHGSLMPVYALRWRSLDPKVATVDSAGVVHPSRPGQVTIEASAGGWRTVRKRFIVVERPATLLFSETWSEPLEARWQPYGTPFPKIVHDSLIGDAFWNNGDGTFFSGAYLREPAFDARDGLALDATVRTPITREQWQYLDLNLMRITDIDGLRRRWDHHTGYLPPYFIGSGLCEAAYPAGEGPTAALSMSPGGELPRAPGSRLPPIALGVPTRIRVQIMPDGRCGVAVDGVPLSLAPALTHLDSIYVVLQGSSVGTRMLVGPITVRRGVPTDIDWSAIRAIH